MNEQKQNKGIPKGTTKHRKKGGRPPKMEGDKGVFHYNFWLSERENIEFIQLMRRSGAKSITEFITNCILDKPFQVVTTDKSALEICIELSEVNTEIRKIGVNYNQVTKAIHTTFTENKALIFLHKLEKYTVELTVCLQKVISIIDKYENKWLPK